MKTCLFGSSSNFSYPVAVFIYKLICQDTIDERVEEVLQLKQSMSDYIVDDKISEESMKILKNYLIE